MRSFSISRRASSSIAPASNRIEPSGSLPRSFWNCSSCSRRSGSIMRRSRRIWPRLLECGEGDEALTIIPFLKTILFLPSGVSTVNTPVRLLTLRIWRMSMAERSLSLPVRLMRRSRMFSALPTILDECCPARH